MICIHYKVLGVECQSTSLMFFLLFEGKLVSDTLIYDKHLNPVLEKSSDADLEPLVGYLQKKFSESLTFHPSYVEHNPKHSNYTAVIADEIRRMGGNSICNVYRGEGPGYYEIVCDVADQLKAPYKQGAEISSIENSILNKIFNKALEEMSEEERKKLLDEMRKEGINVGGITTSTMVAVFEAGGFYSYQLAVIIANQVAHLVLGHGLSFAANATLTKSLSIIAGPIGWAVCALWSTIDISGPAYSVTIPSVVQVATLRMKVNQKRCLLCTSIISNNTTSKFCQFCLDKAKTNFDSIQAFTIEVPLKIAKKINRSNRKEDRMESKIKKKAAIDTFEANMNKLINPN